ncbi:MAG: zinc-binding dehydrogenase, partial [Chloroflexi bacterium]|nr:zinc-binding dehydrogenase [Chloroflexota bacterium]
LYSAVNEIVKGQGADLVVEAVGHQKETLNTAIRLVKHSGTILAFGVPDENVYPILYSELFRKNAHLITTVTATDMPKDFALAVQLIKTGRINVTPFVTHEFPFSRLKEAFDLFHERRDGVIKVMINYDQAE